MKNPTILDHIDSGHMALPEFQRITDAKSFKRYVMAEGLGESAHA